MIIRETISVLYLCCSVNWCDGLTEAQIAVEKENLRRYMLRLRDRQSIGEIEQKSQDIIDQVLHLHEFVRARGIACYVSKDSEVNTRPLIRAALNMQLIGKVPRDQFDVPVDMVVTESRVIRCHH